jgi:hypothetical protein
MGMELLGLKTAIASAETGQDPGDEDDHELQVEELGRIMARLQAIKGKNPHVFCDLKLVLG